MQRLSLVVGSRGYSLAAVSELLIAGASLVGSTDSRACESVVVARAQAQ